VKAGSLFGFVPGGQTQLKSGALLRWIILVLRMILVDFIMRHLVQIHTPLPLFKPMDQSRRGGLRPWRHCTPTVTN
jgi:hypothetical protein